MVARFCPRRHRRVRMVPSASSTVPPTLSSTRTIFLRRGQHRCPLHFVIHLLTVQSEPSLAFVTFLPPSLSTTTLFSSCFENTASRSAHTTLRANQHERPGGAKAHSLCARVLGSSLARARTHAATRTVVHQCKMLIHEALSKRRPALVDHAAHVLAELPNSIECCH